MRNITSWPSTIGVGGVLSAQDVFLVNTILHLNPRFFAGQEDRRGAGLYRREGRGKRASVGISYLLDKILKWDDAWFYALVLTAFDARKLRR